MGSKGCSAQNCALQRLGAFSQRFCAGTEPSPAASQGLPSALLVVTCSGPLRALVSSHWLSVAGIATGVSPVSTGYYLNTCPSKGPVSFSQFQGDIYSQLGSTTQDPFLRAGANTPAFTDLSRAESFLSELIHSSFSVITQNLELWSKNWGSHICWVMGFKSMLAHQWSCDPAVDLEW